MLEPSSLTSQTSVYTYALPHECIIIFRNKKAYLHRYLNSSYNTYPFWYLYIVYISITWVYRKCWNLYGMFAGHETWYLMWKCKVTTSYYKKPGPFSRAYGWYCTHITYTYVNLQKPTHLLRIYFVGNCVLAPVEILCTANKVPWHVVLYVQGSYWVWDQPIRDDVTK